MNAFTSSLAASDVEKERAIEEEKERLAALKVCSSFCSDCKNFVEREGWQVQSYQTFHFLEINMTVWFFFVKWKLIVWSYIVCNARSNWCTVLTNG